MTRLTADSFATLVLTLACTIALGESLEDELRRCGQLGDDDARLICYDNLLDRNPQSVRAGPSPAPAETTTSAPPEPPGAPDAAAASGAPANFSQEDLFGKSGNEMERTVQQATGSERLDSLSATVTKLEHYAYDKVLVALHNGQVWKQVDSSSLRLRVGDAIEIERASLGSFMLRKKGSKRSMRVSRKD